jgi:hypothetical protein
MASFNHQVIKQHGYVMRQSFCGREKPRAEYETLWCLVRGRTMVLNQYLTEKEFEKILDCRKFGRKKPVHAMECLRNGYS